MKGNPRSSSHTVATPVTNTFESKLDSEDYDDESDWDAGIGNLVIDLDADIERTQQQQQQQAGATLPNPCTSKSLASSAMSSSVEHSATVDKGLKMKIKRKGAKHDSMKGENSDSSGMDKSVKHTSNMDSIPSTKEKNSKGRNSQKKKDRVKGNSSVVNPDQIANGGSTFSSFTGSGLPSAGGQQPQQSAPLTASATASAVTSQPAASAQQNSSNTLNVAAGNLAAGVEMDKIAQAGAGFTGLLKKDAPSVDPYEFNAKVEDRQSLGFPVKKMKNEKMDSTGSSHDVGTETCHVGVVTDPDCLGPCEPGTHVTLEGIVWQETENGMLVVNVTWRGKTYVGTLLDATKHDWAPPRLSSDSPTSDLDPRTPKGRGKRRAAQNLNLNENNLGERKLRKGRSGGRTSTFTAPPSPARLETAGKRKGRMTEADALQEGAKACKRSRSSSRTNGNGDDSPLYIECPEPNCSKKYKHVNGLRYHQTHSHRRTPAEAAAVAAAAAGENDVEMKDCSDADSGPHSPQNTSESTTEKGKSEGKKSKKSRKTKDDGSVAPSPKKGKDPSTPSKHKSDKKDSDSRKEVRKLDLPPPDKVKPGLSNSGTNSVTAGSVNTKTVTATTVTAGSVNSQKSSNTTTVTAVTKVPAVGVPQEGEHKHKKKSDKGDKLKGGKPVQAMAARPIMPAPALPITVSPQTTLAPVTTHAQISQQIATSALKPIQPKPTIMGEPSNANSAIAGLKEKKPKKKKKDKEHHVASQGSKTPANSKSEQVRSDTTVIIPNQQKNDSNNRTKETHEPSDLSKSSTPSKSDRIQQHNVNSPKETPVRNSDAKDPTDAQSPAYSDISDEGAPSLENEKSKDVDKQRADGAKVDEKNADHSMPNPYSMYSYYGQPPYLIPAVSQQQASGSQPGSRQSTPKPAEPDNLSMKDKDRTQQSDKDKKASTPGKPGELGPTSTTPGPHSKHQQGMYGYYGYPQMDPAFHMHMMNTDPMYRQQQEERRRELEKQRERAESNPDRPLLPSEIKIEQMSPNSSGKRPSSETRSAQEKHSPNSKPPALISEKERKMRQEAALKEKQSENHQILKENIELKQQMDDKSRGKSNVPRDKFHPSMMQNRNEEDLRQYYMYQQQQRMHEQQRADGDRRLPHPKEGSHERPPQSKDGAEARDLSTERPHSRDSDGKRLDKIKKEDERGRRSISPARTTPRPKEGAITPTSSSPSMPPGSYPPYMSYPPYAGVPYDPSHPLYRGVNPMIPFGDARGGPPFIHPQMARFHPGHPSLPPEAVEKNPMLSPGMASSPGEPPKGIDMLHPRGHYYGPQPAGHKIHELAELAKARESGTPPKPGSASPKPGAAGDKQQDKPTDYSTRSPPPQRHLHTHHHTHVVNPSHQYPMYPDPYGAIIASQGGHPFAPK